MNIVARSKGFRFLALGSTFIIFLGVLLGTFILGYRQGGGASPFPPRSITGSQNVKGENPTQFGVFWQAWNIVNDKFYGQKDDSKRVDGAIAGMVASLGDPYTVYLEPSENKLFQDDLGGNFGGIGAELSVKDGKLTIVSALEGSPAQKALLQGQDVIIEVAGKKTSEMSFGEAIQKIRGEKGTQIELTIVRAGTEQPFKVSLTRDTIVVKSVKTESIGVDGQTAYIKVNQFGDDTDQLLEEALKNAQTKKSIILDLRDNPGGYLGSAVQTIGMIVPDSSSASEQVLKDRVAVLERDKNGGEQKHVADNTSLVASIPMVVLVNKGSASASEIVAGALKDYKRATIVGQKTFGKGSVQELRVLSNGGSVKVTIAKWFTPLGGGIDGKGIDPDVIVELPEQTMTSTTDLQVQKALELLNK